jgi:hypothetical protein
VADQAERATNELTAETPMLVGLAVDVSQSMTAAIEHRAGTPMNRLEAVRESLKKLAMRGRDLVRGRDGCAPVSLVKLFAYGFGFGNPLSVILGRSGPAVRDLLQLERSASSLVSLSDLADRWDDYEQHLRDLAVEMLGSTPMVEALEAVQARFQRELDAVAYYHTPALFLLSDGLPRRGTSRAVLERAAALRARGTLVVSCYVTEHDVTEPRRLYGSAPAAWPDGAKLLFDCASEVPEPSDFMDYLVESGWTVDPGGKFFAQINQTEILEEFLNAVIGPAEQKQRLDEASDMRPAEVFISHSHEDAEFRDQLERHLAVLLNTGVISTWHDRKIVPGQEWLTEIERQIESADVILLLVSENFLSSPYCYGIEMKRALERHKEGSATVIPVILDSVDWKGAPFDKLQVLPTGERPVTKWPSRAEGFTDVAKGIRLAIQAKRAR